MDLTKAIDDKPAAEGIAGFDAAQPAAEYSPIPPGIYQAVVQRGEYGTTKAGADCYRMRFEVSEGEQAGRTVTRTWTFSARAIGYSKRDLSTFGLTTSAQLLSQFPPAGTTVRVRLVVAMQRGDDGVERNDIKRIDVLATERHPAAEYLLADKAEGGPG